MKHISKALDDARGAKRPKNLATEFQQYGVYLSEQLDDPKHVSLYVKLAKNMKRKLLEEALIYTKGYLKAKSKAKLFMWRLNVLKQMTKGS